MIELYRPERNWLSNFKLVLKNFLRAIIGLPPMGELPDPESLPQPIPMQVIDAPFVDWADHLQVQAQEVLAAFEDYAIDLSQAEQAYQAARAQVTDPANIQALDQAYEFTKAVLEQRYKERISNLGLSPSSRCALPGPSSYEELRR